MKQFLLFILLFGSFGTATALELDYLRTNYSKAVSDEQLCKAMISDLSQMEAGATYLGYLGALQTVWAQHAKGPIAKLRTFNKGKSNLEKAIEADPKNVELRFLRLSIQQNCPVFLGYRDKIKEDTTFIKENIHQVKSAQLRKMCMDILKIA